jgi:flavin reductase (DIM6/NTAB) family NADH-FMN oxidoreductase RutF
VTQKSIGAQTILFPTPVLIVGTYDRNGQPNLMTAAWGGICCSDPPCLAIALRKATYTYGNLMDKKAFTVSCLSETQVAEADYYGMVSGRQENKWAATGITPVKSDRVEAPYGREFPLVLECRLLHTIEIGLHTQFIGEILDIKADPCILNDEGLPDIDKLKPFFYDPANRNYFGTGPFLGRGFSVGKGIKSHRKE